MTNRPWCNCFDEEHFDKRHPVLFHEEQQNTDCDAWKHLLEIITQAAIDKYEEFAPLRALSHEERSDIITLPPTIRTLTHVKHLFLYGSHLVRIPPEIGEMAALEEFTPYTSYRLHWFPYEITRCTALKRSTVSTRALYGNFKFRPPFPKLQTGRITTEGLDLTHLNPGIWGASSIQTCSVCNRSLTTTGLYQVWISLPVATDVLPLLVNACSQECITKLPKPPDEYVQTPHLGGIEVAQSPGYYDF